MFRVYCDNKGCGKDMEPLLNVETNEVECTECGRDIKSIHKFTNTQMKSFGQIKRDQKAKQAFSVQCKTCMKDNPPKLGEGDKILCGVCGVYLDYLTAPYAHAVREFLKSRQTKNQTTVEIPSVNVSPKVIPPVR